jgi:drug/metabolite transporter (DMT)-like permease
MVGLLGLIWGGTFLVTEIALRGITPFWLAAARTVVAALLMLAIWQARGRRLFADAPDRRALVRLGLIGALSSAVPFALLSWGQQYVTSGFAGVSMAAVALIVLPLAHVLLPGERATPLRAAGFAIGFAGVVVLIGTQAFEPGGHPLELAGRLACLGAAACYAVSSVQMRLLPPVDSIGLSTVTLLIGAAIAVTSALIAEGAPPLPDAPTLAALAILGLLPTAAANLLRVLVIRSAGPGFMSLTNYQVPVWSVLLGALVLGEPLPPGLLSALALILAGVALTQHATLRRLFAARR